MTILSAVNAASLRVVGTTSPALFSATDQVMKEMRDLVQDVAEDIAKSQDWRDLTRIATFNGDGGMMNFPKPADFDRMLVSATVDDQRNWFWGYFPFATVNEFMQWRNMQWGQVTPGGWIILGGEFQFQPAPIGVATFPYMSNEIARSADGAPQQHFEADTDTFVLSERLLTLGLIWRYRAQKGLEYSEDMRNYELALTQAQTRDAGSVPIRSRGVIRRGMFSTAYSGTVF